MSVDEADNSNNDDNNNNNKVIHVAYMALVWNVLLHVSRKQKCVQSVPECVQCYR